jgi:ABC-2 type transport system permease protein
MKTLPANTDEPVVELVEAPRRALFGPLLTLFWLTLRQQSRGRRLLLLSVLFALPVVVAGLTRYNLPKTRNSTLEFVLLFTLFPHALLPLAALWYGSGMIQDEIEDQTLTYLLVRPVRRWAIYLAKLLATVLITGLLATIFCLATYAAIYVNDAGVSKERIAVRALQTAALFALALCAYCSLFGCLSLFFRRSLMLGVVYIGVFEGFIANIPFVVRDVTVMYYFRLLVTRWLHADYADWKIDPFQASSSATALTVLLAASAVTTVIAATGFSVREFGQKTPESS